MNKYKHLTQQERYSIERMGKAGYKQNEIAGCLGRSESTISRELRRNLGQRGYRHGQAQQKADERRFESLKRVKFTPQLQWIVEEHLRNDLSPEQITGVMRRNAETTVSHERIYQHIYSDHHQGGDLHLHLRQGRKKRRRRLGRTDRRGRIPNRVSIDERPASVESKHYYGDWEADLIIGAKHQGAALTLVERKSKHCLIYPLEGKHSDEVMEAMILVLWPFFGKIRSITVDNGKEFSGHETVSAVLRTQVYFAHPYASWERGLNENTNGLIRQYLPKQSSLKGLTLAQVKRIEDKLNTRPRKTLGFRAPIELYENLIAA
jgi:transposase, IS30 family